MRYSGNPDDMAQIIARTITAEVKMWAAQNFIPQENFRDVELLRDANRYGFTAMLAGYFAGIKDQKSVIERTIGEYPSSLMDWVRFHINRALPSWMEPLKVKMIRVVSVHEETWRICPHVLANMEGRQHMHLRWMEMGGEFEQMPEARRIAAERVLIAALNCENAPIGYASGELMHAVYRYKDAAGLR